MRGKQTNGFNRWWQSKNGSSVKSVVVIVVVFALGVGIGNGAIGMPSPYSGRTGLPDSLNYASIDAVYETLKENYNGKLTESQLIEGMKHGLAEATNDPYTVYFTPKEAESFENDLNNTFSGIGAELGKTEQGSIQVIAPIKGTPAEKAGIRAKDVIATVNGKSTVGMTVDDAVKVIRGEAGTEVTLQIVRSGTEALTLKIKRESIQVPSVTTKTLDGNIGYIQISNFATDTGRLVDEAAVSLKAAGVTGIVLDLRNNPGGSVDSAIAVASQWLPQNAVIMQEKRGSVVTQEYRSTGMNRLGDIPTAILVNNGSASASEIVAAALRDNKRGHIIGEKTYGKGVVQRIVELNDGSELKVTIASWHRPNGKSINKKGITPDQKAVLSDKDAEADNDTQLQAAEQYLKK